MGPKKSRKNVRNIELPTDPLIEFLLGDTGADTRGKRQINNIGVEAGNQVRGYSTGGYFTDRGDSG